MAHHHGLPTTNVTSPVSASRTLCESPQPKNGMNLTGVPRKVKDNCAELHNLVQRWNFHQIQGHKLLREITNIRQNRHIQSPENGEEDDGGSGREKLIDKTTTKTFSVALQRTCEELLQTIEDMSLINAKMHKITSQFETLVSLENLQNSFSYLQNEPRRSDSGSHSSSNPPNPSIPVFYTWTMADYVETSRSLSDSYALDLNLKREIVDIIGHIDSSDAALFLLSAWSHQPHVSDGVQLRLEAMITESGHRYKIYK